MGWNEPGGNGKDPWNNGKKSTPPDLDEALKKLHRKLTRVMGGKSGPGTPSSSGGGTLGVSLIMILAFALWFLSGIFIVAPAEEAVVLKLGRYNETMGPGPHWIPRFIKSKYIVNVQKVSNFKYTAEMLNKDENIVSVSVAVQYRIANPRDYLFNVVNPNESLQQATASALRQVVGHATLDEVLTVGREKIRDQVYKLLTTTLGRYETGIEVTDVAMQPAKAPDEVKAAFDDAIKAQEDEQRYINQAQAYSANVRPIAEGNAKRITQEAQAYKEQEILKANGEVSRFLALLPEYQQAPRVTRQRLYLGSFEHVLENATKVLFDTKGNQNLTFLPLNKLMSPQITKNLKELAHEAERKAEDVSGAKQQIASLLEGSSRFQKTRQGRESYLGRGDFR